jgi:hypothetical protein
MRNTLIACSMAATLSVLGCSKSSPETGAAPSPNDAPAAEATEAAKAADSAPEAAVGAAEAATTGGLTDMLGSKLGLSPEQSKAGVGAILAYAQGALPAADFQKVSAAIPGAEDNLQAVKDAGVTDPITDAAGLNAAFGKLGISPEIANQLVPAVTDYVGKVAGPDTANLLKGLFP